MSIHRKFFPKFKQFTDSRMSVAREIFVTEKDDYLAPSHFTIKTAHMKKQGLLCARFVTP